MCVTNDHEYVQLVVSTSRSFHHSWRITGFVTSLTRWVQLVEQELLTLPEDLSSRLVFSWIRVTGSPVLCVCFVDRFLSFCTFSFGHCVASSFSVYGFLLPLWYLQTLLIKQHFVSTIDPWSNKLVILRNEKHFVYITLLMTIIWWHRTHVRCIVTIYRYK